jgi:hypothetical protein
MSQLTFLAGRTKPKDVAKSHCLLAVDVNGQHAMLLKHIQDNADRA